MQKKTIGIYVHWSFCESKCPYCDFSSYAIEDTDSVDDWISAYLFQLRLFFKILSKDEYTEYSVESIFFGGGTPSLMSPRLVKAIICYIQDNIYCVPDLEVTLESNPSSAEAKKFSQFRDAGVNRLSIGVQAMNDKDLQWLGRKHNLSQAMLAIKFANEFFDNYSFDLIYGRKDQTLDNWEKELEIALDLANNHMSVYSLAIEAETRFASLMESGQLILPDDETVGDLYEATNRILSSNNFTRYEISNYARDGFECRHNMLYWESKDYIGIGPSAVGRIKIATKRCEVTNVKHPKRWLSDMQSSLAMDVSDIADSITKYISKDLYSIDGNYQNNVNDNEDQYKLPSGIQSILAIDTKTQLKEVVLMGLRTKKGLDLLHAKNDLNVDIVNNIQIMRSVENLIHQGLLQISPCKRFLSTTERGMNLYNGVVQRLFYAVEE